MVIINEAQVAYKTALSMSIVGLVIIRVPYLQCALRINQQFSLNGKSAFHANIGPNAVPSACTQRQRQRTYKKPFCCWMADSLRQINLLEVKVIELNYVRLQL